MFALDSHLLLIFRCACFRALQDSSYLTSIMESQDQGGNRQPELIALCTVMLILAALAVILRCLAIFLSKTHRFGWDDIFAVVTLVSSS